MAEIWTSIPAIISAIGVIAAAWFSYNQYTKNKTTDKKFEELEKRQQERTESNNRNFAIIYGELWEILKHLEADRVYVIQPHPLHENRYLSVALEVNRKGISKMKTDIQKLPMGEVAVFARTLAQHDMIFYRNVLDIDDKITRGIFSSKGTYSVFIKNLSDGKNWVGNIICEFTRPCHIERSRAEKILNDKAHTIAYILPEFK